jgi:DNA repair exonuclease SbcCD ATPase subunit
MCDLRVELASTNDNLVAKTTELELKNAEITAKGKELATKNRELAVTKGTCEELALQLSAATQKFEETQRGVAQHTKEEMDALSSALKKESAEKTRLETENVKLEAEMEKLQAEKKRAESEYKQHKAERKQLLDMWGIKRGGGENGTIENGEVIKEVAAAKERLEKELKTQTDTRLNLEKETKRLLTETEKMKLDLEKTEVQLQNEKKEKENALERLKLTVEPSIHFFLRFILFYFSI